ncbi:MAG: hypothetical protein GY751_17550 [Bacteroidetes bacterium]|nr:hypothetical protein [Bacteroidota bacterium]
MGSKPTHKVFFVQNINGETEREKKPFWRQIGVAWGHRSGRGFNMKLDLLPVNISEGELVMLEATEKPDEGGDEA